MRRLITALVLMFSLVVWTSPARAYTFQYTDSSAAFQIKWPNTTITVALSTSLNQPPANIKAGSDVLGAARRALAHWSQNSNVRFVETTSSLQSISPTSGGDGVSLISVADTPDNRAVFGADQIRTGRTRVFFNPANGGITEADLIINPNLQFSTDGTPGTYDLEATLTHELGHFLGLEHSAVIGATMQPRQGQNGLYGLAALTPRTLSDDDRAGIRTLYGPRSGLGAIAGTIRSQSPSQSIFGAHIWAENAATGRVYAGNVTFPNGAYRIDGLPPGDYRLRAEPIDGPISASEIASNRGPYAGLTATTPLFHTIETEPITVTADTTTQDFIVIASTSAPTVNPRLVGINGQLSTIPVPLAAGNTYKLYVGGEGLDRVTAAGVAITSPYFTVNPATFMQQDFGIGVPIITFDVTVAPNAPAGDYSLRLTASGTNEMAYLSGALTIDFPEASSTANPIDDAGLFVRQHYLDFLNREPDAGGLQYWTEQITGNASNAPPPCATGDAACVNNRRVRVSAAFFIENEFQQTGYFVYRMYKASFGQQPNFSQFVADRPKVSGGSDYEAKKQAFADEWVQRQSFKDAYPLTLSPEQFVNKLFDTAQLFPYTTERNQLAADLRSGARTRAQVLRAVIEITEFVNREYNPAFVLMQYFGYLKRNPDPGGYQFWLDVVNNRATNNYLAMVCAFITSAEYQQRFGSVITHTNADCSTVTP